jgi:hypothetical protein
MERTVPETLELTHSISRRPIKVHRGTLIAFTVAVLTMLWWACGTSEERHVILPVITAVNVALCCWIVLWKRDGILPVFDIGAVCIAATLAYTIVPPIQFLLSGMTHTPLSAIQLYTLDPDPMEFGAFTWRYVVYLLSFTIVYPLVRRDSGMRAGIHLPDRITTWVIVSLYFLVVIVMYLIRILYGIGFNVVYDPEILAAAAERYESLPILARQIYGSFDVMALILKFGVLTLLFARWSDRRWRFVIWLWFSGIILSNVFRMGARTELVLTFLCGGLLYHRLVRNLKAWHVAAVGSAMLVAFLIFGLIRGTSSLAGNIELARSVVAENKDILLSIGTEFQVLFGGAYDLHHMISKSIVKDIPWQIYFSDLQFLIPRQLLPFDKIDVQEWYIQLHDTKWAGFFMHNPIAQASIGLGWVELVLRGGFVAWILALVHNWYLRKGQNFWVFLFYLWLMLEAYYTIRSSTFTIFAFILFRFIPLYVMTMLCVNLARRLRSSENPIGGASPRDPIENLTLHPDI